MSTLIKPATYLGEVYSNLDHELNDDVSAGLMAKPGDVCAQHSAWDFCGYIWRTADGRWVDQIWQHGAPVEDIIGDDLGEVIQQAIDSYGGR